MNIREKVKATFKTNVSEEFLDFVENHWTPLYKGVEYTYQDVVNITNVPLSIEELRNITKSLGWLKEKSSITSRLVSIDVWIDGTKLTSSIPTFTEEGFKEIVNHINNGRMLKYYK